MERRGEEVGRDDQMKKRKEEQRTEQSRTEQNRTESRSFFLFDLLQNNSLNTLYNTSSTIICAVFLCCPTALFQSSALDIDLHHLCVQRQNTPGAMPHEQ